jgi:CRISPR/Cas system-associated protein Cas7 (RAMP superfamily)
MKSIKDTLNEALNESKNPVPSKGMAAVDYNGDPWEVIDFCQVKDKSKLKKLMREYDTGSLADELEYYDDDNYVVAAVNADDDRDVAMFLWDPSGLWVK